MNIIVIILVSVLSIYVAYKNRIEFEIQNMLSNSGNLFAIYYGVSHIVGYGALFLVVTIISDLLQYNRIEVVTFLNQLFVTWLIGQFSAVVWLIVDEFKPLKISLIRYSERAEKIRKTMNSLPKQNE